MKKLKLKNLKRGWRVKLTSTFFLKVYDPITAQIEGMIGSFGDPNSCFREGRQNSHHPQILKKHGWWFLAVYKNGKEHSRCFVKFQSTTVLAINFYGQNGQKSINNLQLVLSKLFGEYKEVPSKVYGGVYVNGGRMYIYKR